MRKHYEELLHFFRVLTVKPSVLVDHQTVVFVSEPCLYSNSSSDKLNHRLKKDYIPVRNELYKPHKQVDDILFPMIAAAGKAMGIKLEMYMKDYLPGGRYHENANAETQSILSELKPNNDMTESVFGCND